MNDPSPFLSAPNPGAATRPLLFLHIPKTAGTSFLTILRNVFGDAGVIRLDSDHTAAAAELAAALGVPGRAPPCLAGHVPLHLCRPYLDRVRMFTMLREPVARVFSLYRFLQRADAETLALHGLAPGFDFNAFITCRNPVTFGQISNGMCRMLGDNPALTDGDARAFWYPDAIATGLQTAMDFLRETDFGLVEEMPATLGLMGGRWGSGLQLTEVRLNFTTEGGEMNDVEHIHRIAELNAADIALYQAARSLFHARLAMPAQAAAEQLWQPPIGAETPLGDIPARQGFHDWESGTGFAWLQDNGPAQIAFAAPPAREARLALRFYLVNPVYDPAQIAVRLNGAPVAMQVAELDGQWCTLIGGPLRFGAGAQTLSITTQYAVPVRFLVPGSADTRSLGAALASVSFYD